MRCVRFLLLPLILLSSLFTCALASTCLIPDNGTGTGDLPPPCADGYLGTMQIVDGLPPGTTIEIEARWTDFTAVVRTSGGILGGEVQEFGARLEWQLTGTGALAGFQRTINLLPQCEVHTGPRTLGDPIQTFAGDVFVLTANHYGDPDFCDLSLVVGTGLGLPSPGQTTLTRLPDGNYNVDSFFDITYRIDFVGCPGSILEGLAGSTVGTRRFQAGEPLVSPGCALPDNGSGTIDLPPACPEGYLGGMNIVDGMPAGSTLDLATTLTDFMNVVRTPDNSCLLPDNGGGTIDLPPDCADGYAGHMTILDGLPPGTSLEMDATLLDPVNVLRTSTVSCPLPDNGTGTADLPPACPDGYAGHLSIIDGLPPGTTVELDAVLTDFVAVNRFPGGVLGGEVEQFQATLDCPAYGTGLLTGFTRQLAIPVTGEMHHGPRNPGDPVQTMPARLVYLNGELFGDPDFCSLRVRAGEDLGLPGPGQTTLTRLPSGDYAVDSFFDITYEIEFEGCPGSVLDGFLGTTTDTQHFHAGEPFTGIGEIQQFDATLAWSVSGTGDLTGFSRTLFIPVVAEVHTGPRNPGDPVQTFFSELVSLNGELYGDPDFCSLRVRAGAAAGLPSPGQTTLTRLPSGDFAVDSFFDITYEIDFEGCPGSVLDGFQGTTTDTEPFHAGEPFAGGELQEFDASLNWEVTGTGNLTGFNRTLTVPVHVVTHSGLVPAGDAVQTFGYDLLSLQGQLFGDPDFCELRVRAGVDLGLPSPGLTKLTQLSSGLFSVDSFFDITYEIEFEGCPGAVLEGLSGITSDGTRLQTIPFLAGAAPDDLPGTEAARYVLHDNTPNPFNPNTAIRFEVPHGGGRVKLEVYDMRGRLVRTLVDAPMTAGVKTVPWDGTDRHGRRVASGVYLYALHTQDGVLTQKMAMIK